MRRRTLATLPLVLVLSASPLSAEDRLPAGNGDVNGDSRIDLTDVIFTLDFLFGEGPEPVPIPAAAPSREPTIVYLVRHAEDDKSFPNRPLTAEGQARAELLADRFRDAGVTHVFSTHKTRTFQTAEPTALDHGLEVEQVPAPGSLLEDGEVVTEETSTSRSIEPMIEAIESVPPGSVVLAAGHSSTLFAVMAGLGVEVATPEDPCEEGETSCLPCTVKACFPGGFENLWTVTLPATPAAEATMARLHYGDVCPAAVE